MPFGVDAMTDLVDGTETASGILDRRYRPAAIAIFTTVALAAFEGMAVSAALPQVAADLGDVGLLPWVITSFLLASSIVVVLSGPFIDGLGPRRIFRIAVIIFTVTGTAAAFAPSMAIMIVLRVLQGIGAGLLLSSTLSGVALVYPQHLIGRAFAANSTVWGVMSVAGPALAAAMLTYLNWRWIFLINLPLGLISLLAGWRTLPGPVEEASVRLDVRGSILVAGLTTTLLVALDAIGPWTLVWLAVSAVLGVLYLRHARRHPQPIVRLEHLFTQPYLGLAVGTGLLLAGGIAVSSYTPLYIRAGREGSTGVTAWSVLFFSIGWTAGANISSRLLDRWSESAVAVLGFAFTVPGLVGLAAVAQADVSLVVIFALLCLSGLGIGFSTNAGLTLLRAVTASASIGRVTSVYQFARSQGIAAGAAMGGAVMLLVIERQIGDVEAVRAVLAGDTSGELGSRVPDAVQAGFAAAAATGAVISIVGGLMMIQMRSHLAEARAQRRAVQDPAGRAEWGDGQAST